MARKKRGGKAAANARKTKAAAKAAQAVEENPSESQVTTNDVCSTNESEVQSEESCSSGTPKSCNTPIEIDKNSTLVQHKKFGKFRCLLVEDGTKTEVSSSESEVVAEMQTDPLQTEIVETKDDVVEELTIETEHIIEEFKSVEISDVETTYSHEEIPICLNEQVVIEEEIIEEDVIEIDHTQMEQEIPLIETESTVMEIETEEKVEFTIQSDESQEQCLVIPEPETIVPEEPIEEVECEEIKSEVESPITIKEEIKETTKEPEIKEPEVTEPEKESTKESSKNKKQDDSKTTTVRRSSRIKSISVLKQRSKGRGLVKSDKSDKKEKYKSSRSASDLEIISENSNSNTASEKNSNQSDSPSFATPTIGLDSDQKPVKVKSRWRRSSELEMGGSSPLALTSLPQSSPSIASETNETQKAESPVYDEEMEARLRQFQTLLENQYLTERTTCKEAKKMLCDCFLTKEEIKSGEFGCGDDCLNRLLMIECGSHCTVGDRCTNKRFQKMQYATCEVFRTEKKGFGIRATHDIPYGEFILEYVGEVLDPDEFDKRAKHYSKDKNRHYYFMALRADAVIDATQKGNISRFINHSCDPNAETQKWTVNGELRIGFFSKRTILAGEEVTFDYQFQRYGKEAQKCFCDASNCRGWIGEEPNDDDDDDDDEDDDEESEEEPEDEAELESKETDSPEADIKERKAVVVKPIRRRRLLNKKQRKDIFEDLDLDEEIGMLSTTGVKNQAHTLKLSRLMVRAKDVGPRMQLLRLLRDGELPCRRLFLDYHGLRLIHGWMGDAASMTQEEHLNFLFRIEILQTLASLPIPNKTLLQDSKVLSTVEKWSGITKTEIASSSPIIDGDSSSNSPQIDAVVVNKDVIKKESIKLEAVPAETSKLLEESSKMLDDISSDSAEESTKLTEEFSEKLELKDESSSVVADTPKQDSMEIVEDVKNEVIIIENEEEIIKIEDSNKNVEDMDIESPSPETPKEAIKIETNEKKEEITVKEEVDIEMKDNKEKLKEKIHEYIDLIIKLTTKLLADWSILKEVFRIPKKERIEQMKEHEREANRDYKAGLGLEQETHSKRYSWDRYRIIEKERRKAKELEHERNLAKKALRIDDRNILPIPKLSKHERRQLFALQVAQEEEGRRRKQEQEMWRVHEQRCMMMGTDPRLTNLEITQNFQWSWNPNTGQWQQFPPGMPPPPGPGLPPPPGHPGHHPPPNQPPPMYQPPPPQHMPLMMPPHPGNPMVNPNRPPLLPPQPFQPPPIATEEKVIFAGPIPPPVALPPKWKCAKDKYGRPYYYHIKTRIPQWEPPEFTLPVEETTTEIGEDSSSSSESSSLTSDSTSDSDDASEIDDTKLLLEIRNKLNLKQLEAKSALKVHHHHHRSSPNIIESPIDDVVIDTTEVTTKRKRVGLVQEIIISPRREEDKIQSKADIKKYKETKEKLRRQKMALSEQAKKKLKSSKAAKTSSSKGSRKHRLSKAAKLKSISNIDMNSEEARKIKEIFRSSMASVMVANLNAYRKPDCKSGRITNTEDFKHLARKLTHFVMLKELKHCQHIEDLTCNESVKSKAKDFVRKYMAKFGEVYSRPKDDTTLY